MTPPKQDNSAQYFPKLNLEEFRNVSEAWTSQFPVIERLSLYRGVDVNKGKYVVDVRVNDQDGMEYRRFERDWIDHDYYIDALQGVYKEQKCYSHGDWLVLISRTGDEPLEAHVVLEETRFDLTAIPASTDDTGAPETVTAEGRKDDSKHKVFPCNPGTKWEDITMIFVDDSSTYTEMFRIKTPEGEGLFTYHQLEMQDKRNPGQPKKIWKLLKEFGQFGGLIHSGVYTYDKTLPKTAYRLNTHLKKLFGINESIYQAHYKKEKAYRTRIKFVIPGFRE